MKKWPAMRTIYRTVMYLLMITLIQRNTATEALRVIGGNVTVVQGDTAVLPCFLTDSSESLTQISWQRKTRLIRQNSNFYTILSKNGPEYFNGNDERFSFIGNIFEKNGSLQLSNVTLSDEGTYTCIYTLFPSGNYKTEIPLNVLVPPVTRVKDNFLTEGVEEVAFASCTASGSRPSAQVNWLLDNLANSLRTTSNSTENADGTIDTVSSLFGVPTRDLNHHTVQCVIKSPAQVTTLPLIIQIHFSPSEVIVYERSKNSFECVAEANPKSNITWSRSGQPWPESAVRIDGAVLNILRPTPDLNGLFQCKAFNAYGIQHGHLYVHLSSEGPCTACWTLFGILLFFNVLTAAVWYYKYGQFLRSEGIHNIMQSVNTTETAATSNDVEFGRTVHTPETSAPQSVSMHEIASS